MPEAFICDAVRTPIGRLGGALSAVRPDDLAALVVAEAVRRAGVDPGEIEEVYLGCANQAGEDNRNVARMAALLAGLPHGVPGATITVPLPCDSGMSPAGPVRNRSSSWADDMRSRSAAEVTIVANFLLAERFVFADMRGRASGFLHRGRRTEACERALEVALVVVPAVPPAVVPEAPRSELIVSFFAPALPGTTGQSAGGGASITDTGAGVDAGTGAVGWTYQAIAEPARILSAPSVAIEAAETATTPHLLSVSNLRVAYPLPGGQRNDR